MNAKQAATRAYDGIEAFAENALLKLVSRAAMAIVALLAGLVWKDIDAAKTNINDVSKTLPVITQSVETLRLRIDDKTVYFQDRMDRAERVQAFRDGGQDRDRQRIENRLESIERQR